MWEVKLLQFSPFNSYKVITVKVIQKLALIFSVTPNPSSSGKTKIRQLKLIKMLINDQKEIFQLPYCSVIFLNTNVHDVAVI